ncbi:hypothetical protein I5E68_04710 [Novosphingobium sp. YJ-S2-02]|uniref:Uncharacterized protein n=1 Tax=Novosphingobium aureum TaxID=2792964 RepID=A0A931MK93_9SPHN|nr:hypothetical protein [Novosphingobium aureum]MBH0112255.1 hypothetical protein [Novosphingobium aureum]
MIACIAELEQRHLKGWEPVSEADICRWTNGAEGGVELLYDSIGAELARGYHERRYSFEFCDEVVNDLNALLIDMQFSAPPHPWPKLFLRVYEAFDAGEYHRKPDRSDDPVSEFTDPYITKIVRSL